MGPSGDPLSIVGASWYLIPRIGPSRLEGAVRDLTQFGVLCIVELVGCICGVTVYHVIKANKLAYIT